MMDETDLRTMLRGLADTVDGSAGIDLPLAAKQGLRGRHRRRLRIGGSVLAMAAATGLIAAVLAVPGHRTAGVAPAVPAAPAPPARFNSLVLYASFGWVPPGYTRVMPGEPSGISGPARLVLLTYHGSNRLSLAIYPAGACTRTSAQLSCPQNVLRVVQAAPKVNGRQALWLQDKILAWQYAPGAWAMLSVGPGARVVLAPGEAAILRHIAATVRYGQSTPLEFPYWMPKPSASWQLSGVEFTERAGRALAVTTTWQRGAALASSLLNVEVTPQFRGSCPAVNTTRQRVTLDGASAILADIDGPPAIPDVCAADVHGWTVAVDVVAETKTTVSLSTVLGYARALRLRTSDPAQWTTDPFR